MASLQNCSTKHDTLECNEGSILPDFRALSVILQSLTNNDGDGRIILSRSQTTCSRQGGYIKYVMLSGEKIFSEVLPKLLILFWLDVLFPYIDNLILISLQIVNQAHAVLLAGGTLQPIEETRERLFPWLPTNQLQFFSCSHIVPPESILPVAVSCGPSGQSFDFSYSSRSSLIMVSI